MSIPPPTTNSETPEDDREFPARLKSAREARGLTQGGVATRSKMADPDGKGISRTAIIGYEQGTTKPGLRELRLLCQVLLVTPNWLIFGTDTAAAVTLPSTELLRSRHGDVKDAFVTALALMTMKRHERDAIQALTLSIAGRQLGDMGVSALLGFGGSLSKAFETALANDMPEITPEMSVQDITKRLSTGVTTNFGNRFKLDDEGEILNPQDAIYPDPDTESQ